MACPRWGSRMRWSSTITSPEKREGRRRRRWWWWWWGGGGEGGANTAIESWKIKHGDNTDTVNRRRTLTNDGQKWWIWWWKYWWKNDVMDRWWAHKVWCNTIIMLKNYDHNDGHVEQHTLCADKTKMAKMMTTTMHLVMNSHYVMKKKKCYDYDDDDEQRYSTDQCKRTTMMIMTTMMIAVSRRSVLTTEAGHYW